MASASLPLWACLFLAVAIYLLARHWRDDTGVGLLLAYVVSFGVLHWLTPVLYLLPWYWNARMPLSAEGLRQSTYALMAFAAGGEMAALWLRRRMPPPFAPTPGQPFAPPPVPESTPVDARVVNLFLATGVVMYAVVLPLSGHVPSLTAVASAGSTLALAGIALKCWNGWETGNTRTVAFWLLLSAFLPWLTVITQGFLGYGFAALLTVFAFAGSVYRPRWKSLAAGLMLAFFGLSVYVTYMRDRRDIRALVWTNADMSTRFDRLVTSVNEAEWFSLANEDHLDRIEKRLNQDALVGAGVSYLAAHPAEFARGDTLWQAAAAMIPRALWPDKPIVAGSGDLVSRYTGIRFAEDTSVGIGQVMECYVNFAETGIVVGFLIIGALIVTADRLAIRALRRRDAVGFAIWFLPGLSLLQIGGSFAELTSTAAAALLVVLALRLRVSRLAPDGPDEADQLLAELPAPANSEAWR